MDESDFECSICLCEYNLMKQNISIHKNGFKQSSADTHVCGLSVSADMSAFFFIFSVSADIHVCVLGTLVSNVNFELKQLSSHQSERLCVDTIFVKLVSSMNHKENLIGNVQNVADFMNALLNFMQEITSLKSWPEKSMRKIPTV